MQLALMVPMPSILSRVEILALKIADALPKCLISIFDCTSPIFGTSVSASW
jgi:hypothetical protein